MFTTIKERNICKGLSMIDVIIASALVMIVFVGISGAFKVILTLSMHNKAKVGALAIANERMELIRNLSYDNIGTVSGIPSGNIPQTETVSLNGIDYTRRVLVQFVDAPEDGTGGSDTNGINTDYKRVKVEVSWNFKGENKSVYLVSNFVPKGIETTAGGGTLIINVLDAASSPVANASVHIENNTLIPVVSIDTFTDINGKTSFPGSPAGSGYEITVTKTGYSTAKTYTADASNPNPNPGHLTVIEGETTVSTFQIDVLSLKRINTFEQIKTVEWEDLFNDISKISLSASTTVSDGKLSLFNGGSGYESDGYAYSATVTPAYLNSWDEIQWEDNKPPSTNIRYKVYDASGVSPILIPDSDIPGNSSGLTTSPIDVSSLSTSTYPALQVAAFLTTEDSMVTPSVFDWKIKYKDGPIPLPNIAFSMTGSKTIGTDTSGSPIYKYSKNLQTDASGSLSVDSLEWDTYNITVNNSVIGYDIGESCYPQPLSLPPNTSTTTNLYFVPQTTNSLLVAVKNSSGDLLDGVSVRLYKTGTDITQTTSSCGQTHFANISSGTVLGGDPYSIDLSLLGYTNTTIADIDVSGPSTISVMIDD
jgi:hypothetical protein